LAVSAPPIARTRGGQGRILETVLPATGILMLRRSLMKHLAEIFIVIGAMLPGMATVILEVSLHRPLSVLVAASLSVGSGLVAAGILMLRQKAI